MEVGCAVLSVKPRPYVRIVLGEAMELEDTENNGNCDWGFLGHYILNYIIIIFFRHKQTKIIIFRSFFEIYLKKLLQNMSKWCIIKKYSFYFHIAG